VVVDLVRIGTMDGSARDTLVKMLKRTRSQGGDMVVHWAGAVRPAP
jgi:anti-anti-sigma regulatory factor